MPGVAMGERGEHTPTQRTFTVTVTSRLWASVSSSVQGDDTTYLVVGGSEEHALCFPNPSHPRAGERFAPLSSTSSVKSLNPFAFFLHGI